MPDISKTLLERLEKATGPDRALDGDIAVMMGLFARRPVVAQAPHYTASLDAALTLVPEGTNCHGYELDPTEVMAYVSRNNVATGHWVKEGYHKNSPAIALCIACLRARP